MKKAMECLILVQESLKNVRGVAWDDHTNTKRWQHTATNLGGDRGHGADAESEITEEAEGVARSGVRGSKFAVDRLPPGQTSGVAFGGLGLNYRCRGWCVGLNAKPCPLPL